jgi:predicted hydrocarbon binding protein
MDLKAYYQKIRDLEQDLKRTYAVVVSLETADGGAAGVLTEVAARLAAKMIVEGRARRASKEEEKEFLEHKLEAKRVSDHVEATKRMQITVLSESDLRASKGVKSPAKQ